MKYHTQPSGATLVIWDSVKEAAECAVNHPGTEEYDSAMNHLWGEYSIAQAELGNTDPHEYPFYDWIEKLAQS